MNEFSRRSVGFSLIELMVSLAVALVLATIAQPSFESLRQRAAIRGAGEHLLGFWNQSRLEAAKSNRLVKVGLRQSDGGSVFCLGAATTVDPADETPCDCRQAAPASDVCDVARFPDEQSDWKGVHLAMATLGGGADLDDLEPVVIEPRRTGLVVAGDAGSLTLASPTGRFNYRLNFRVDRFGRATLCESTSASDRLPDYGNRQCAD